MAKNVWKKMKASDSRECRNCHAFEYMDFALQETRAGSEHQRAIDEGMTCIDCHQGIAHKLPPNYLEEYENVTNALSAALVTDLRFGALIDNGSGHSYIASLSEK